MIAAIYARYSSEGQREASIDDQYRNCTQYAEHQGWTIVDRYHDHALSGMMDERQRPGFRKLLDDARARRFEVLLVDDLARLSRDSAKTEELRRQFVFWRIRLIGVSDGIDTANKGHKLLSGMKGIMNDVFLDDLAERTHRGLVGQALKGFSCGGRTYGYRHVPITDATQVDEYGRPRILAVKREIDDEQAHWVRQIFTWCAAGRSPRWIAGELNRLSVPAPGAAYKRKSRGKLHGTWSASALHGVRKQGTGLLHNLLYIGRLIWNRRDWVRNPETKRKTPQLRPESEWIVSEQPQLRIIPQELWERVQGRSASRPMMRKGTPVTNMKYLLSGLLKCGVCDSRYVMADYLRYACSGYLNRRHCENRLRVRRDLVETRCLDGLKRELLTPERLELALKEMARLFAERQKQERPERTRLERQLSEVESQLKNLLAAIKQGIYTMSTKLELEALEAKHDQLQSRLRQGMQRGDQVIALLPRAKERYEAVVSRLNTASPRHIDAMREQIRELVGDIRLLPTAEGYLEAEMRGRYEGLLKLAVGSKNSVGCGGRI
jgi:DNA invertase Pin-like site-specific DNA recombinase